MAALTAHSFAGVKVCSQRASLSGTSRTRLAAQAATSVPKEYKGIKPLGDRVVVKVDREEARTTGGLLLPSAALKKQTAGTIVGLGEVKLVKAGDRVLYSKYAGTEIAIGEDEHVLLKEDDVIGVLSSDDRISKLKPLGDRVLIKMPEAQKQSSGGVLLATESAEKPNFGTVVAVGDGKPKEDGAAPEKPNLKLGSTVLYSKYSGTEFEDLDDEKYIVVRESDVLAALA